MSTSHETEPEYISTFKVTVTSGETFKVTTLPYDPRISAACGEPGTPRLSVEDSEGTSVENWATALGKEIYVASEYLAALQKIFKSSLNNEIRFEVTQLSTVTSAPDEPVRRGLSLAWKRAPFRKVDGTMCIVYGKVKSVENLGIHRGDPAFVRQSMSMSLVDELGGTIPDTTQVLFRVES